MGDKGVSIIMIAALMLLAGILPLMMNAEAKPPTRAPDKYGHITSDETWTGRVYFDDIIIDEGVTVTIRSNSELLPYTDAFFWIRGTLLVDGTERNPVKWGASGGSSWQGIAVNTTGDIQMKNFTMYSAADFSIVLSGNPSTIKEGYINGSDTGLLIEDSTGHVIQQLVIEDNLWWGLAVQGMSSNILLEDILIKNTSFGGIGITETSGITIRNLNLFAGGYYQFYGSNIDSVDINGMVVDEGPGKISLGMYLTNMVTDFHAQDVEIKRTTVAILLATSSGSTLLFEDLRTGSKVNTSIGNNDAEDSFSVSFINCTLDAYYAIIRLTAPDPTMEIQFFNTTWNKDRIMDLGENGWLLISWYVDISVVDGNRDPLHTKVHISSNTPGIPFSLDCPDGRIEKSLFIDKSYRGPSVSYYYTYDITIDPVDHPGNSFAYSGWDFTSYMFWRIELDLRPTNDMPVTLNISEDYKRHLDLYDHFSDPEGKDLIFDIKTSNDIEALWIGSMWDGHLIVENTEPDWYGTGWMYIKARDQISTNFTEANVTVNVLPVNDAPRFIGPLPVLTMDEGSWAYFNFTGKVVDPEGDEITFDIPEMEGVGLDFNTTTLNLTIKPMEDINGIFLIAVNISDGDAWKVGTMKVNVTPVNDPPEAVVRYPNGSKAMTEEVPLTPSENVTAWILDLDEDGSIAFRIDATDVDSEELTYSFMEDDLEHGMIEVETYRVEVIINTTTNETEMQNVTVPMNFTYTPYANDFRGDLVRFMVDDGELNVTFRVMFRVAAVNDPPVLDIPEEWNITVNMDSEYMLDLASMLSDIDGDTLVITTNSDFATVNQTEITFLYNNTFTEALEEVDIMVSDGTVTRTWKLTVNVIATSDDDDDDDEPSISDVKVTGKEDSWTVEVTGDEGMTIFFIVEDEDGNRASYPLTYSSGKYTAEVPKEDAEKGYDYWISDTENGDTLEDAWSGSLPSLKEEQDDDFPLWLVIIPALLILIAIAIVLIAMSPGSKGDEYEE